MSGLDSGSGSQLTVDLVFTVVDRDGSNSIDGDELLTVLSALNFNASPALLQYISENCNDMGREDLAKLLSATANVGGTAVKGNLGMLSSPLPELGAVTVSRDTMDEVLGSSTLVRDALVSLGLAPEGSLGPSERARFYASYWNSLTGGAWAVPGHELDATLMMHIRAAITRVVRAAIACGRLEPSGASRGLKDLTDKLNPDDANLLTYSALSLRKHVAGDVERRPAWAATTVPFPAFADALEALVQLADGHGSRAPGSLLLWRLFLLVRVTEGFPIGAPHAAAAESGFGLLSHGLASKLATEDDTSNLAIVRPPLCGDERYCVDVGPQQSEHSSDSRIIDTPIPPSAILRRWAGEHQRRLEPTPGRRVRIAGDIDEFGAMAVRDDDDDMEAGVMSRLVRPDAIASTAAGNGPCWIDLRWSSKYIRPVSQMVAFGRDSGLVRRAWWSPGACRILDLRVDEEDAVKLPSLHKAATDLMEHFSSSARPSAHMMRVEQQILGGVLAAAAVDPAALMLQRAKAWLDKHSGDTADEDSASATAGFFGADSTPVLGTSASSESAALETAGAKPSAAWSRTMVHPVVSSQPRAGVRGSMVQPRAITWFQRFEARIALDPTGDAAIARWLFTVLSDPRPAASFTASPSVRAEALKQGAVVLGEASAMMTGADTSVAMKRCGADSMRQSRSVIEAGGPSILSHLMALWYRTNLEVASAASAADAMRAGGRSAGAMALRGGSTQEGDARIVATVADRFQVPAVEPRDASPSSAAGGDATSATGMGTSSTGADGSMQGRSLGAAVSKGEDAMRSKWDGSPMLERLRVVLEGFPSSGDSRESALDGALPLTWSRAMEVAWPVMRDDTLYAAYSLCFPPQQSWRLGMAPYRDELEAGQVTSDLLATAAASSALPVWDGSGIPMGNPGMRSTDQADGGSAEAAAAAAESGLGEDSIPVVWDGVDPFQPEARWQAFRPRPEGCRPPSTGGTMSKVLEMLSRRGAGRVSVLRWLLEASDEPSSARRCGIMVRDEGILKAYDSKTDAADNWTISVAVAVWAQVHKAAVKRASTSPYGSHLGRIKWGDDVAVAHEHAAGGGLASTSGFEADVAAAATGLPKLNAWSPQLAKGAQVGKEAASVREWARELIGVKEDGSPDPDFRVGWDTIVALMVWSHVERKLPTNAGSYVDMEPSAAILHSSEQDSAAELLAVPEELDWTTPARCMAVLVGLAQSRSTAVRGWAADAKATLAVMANNPNEGRVSASLTKKMPTSALMAKTADLQSRTWRELYMRREELRPKRLSVADWVQTVTAGVDTVAHQPVADGMLCLMSRLLRLVGSDCDELLLQLRSARQ